MEIELAERDSQTDPGNEVGTDGTDSGQGRQGPRVPQEGVGDGRGQGAVGEQSQVPQRIPQTDDGGQNEPSKIIGSFRNRLA